MPELRTDRLVEYVDEQTPPEPPPFELVQHELGRRRRRRTLVATTAVVVAAVIGGVTATGTLRAGEEPAAPPSAPTTNVLDDGPPPDRFQIGRTWVTLRGEVAVMSVRADRANRQALLVQVPPARNTGSCLPQRVVRILAQDQISVRVAAYEYAVEADQPEGQHCVRAGRDGGTTISLELRQDLAGRTVLAGSSGNRVVLN